MFLPLAADEAVTDIPGVLQELEFYGAAFSDFICTQEGPEPLKWCLAGRFISQFLLAGSFYCNWFYVKGENWPALISDSLDTAGGVSSEVTVRSLDLPHTLACTTLWEGADGDSFSLWLQWNRRYQSNNYFSWGFGRNALFYSKASLVSVAPSPAITQLCSAALFWSALGCGMLPSFGQHWAVACCPPPPFWSALGCGVLPPSGLSLMLELILGLFSAAGNQLVGG